ncbi:MAG: SDR family NAD(P)-dependent oxidoreductase [Solirubrobacteraceae bacterium]
MSTTNPTPNTQPADRVAGKTVLITGANAGIGKEVARQLALRADTAKIYLGCRNEGRATAAKTELQAATNKSIFEIISIDTTDLTSVRSAVATITGPVDAVIMNAGGNGGKTPSALTQDGATTMFAVNVLGHVVLLDELIKRHKLTDVALLVGSEAARGIPKFQMKRPAFTTTSGRAGDRHRRHLLPPGQVQDDARLRADQIHRSALDGRDGPQAPRASLHHY